MRKLGLAIAAALVVAAIAPAPATAGHKIRCGNAAYKMAMKDRRVLLRPQACVNAIYKGKSAVLNKAWTRCRRWGQVIVLENTEHLGPLAVSHRFRFHALVVYNTCRKRLDFIVPAPR